MTPDSLFQLASTVALLGWLILLSTPLWPARLRNRWPRLIGGIALPATLAAIYSVTLLSHWAGHPGNFNTLTGVELLFTSPWLVLAGWVHYLAFDLFVGGWELAQSRKRGIPHLAMVPVLLLTFFFGPIGFLAWLTLRSFFPRTSVPAIQPA